MERIERPLYEDRILGLLGRGEVVVLTGHRCAGKYYNIGIVVKKED